MAGITPQMVKELRDKTGAGMADCKKALTQSEGNMEEAIELLRKKGAASAAKRADKVANEGVIIAKTNDNGSVAAIVEINCETDFVARNEEFENYANKVCQALLDNDVKDVDSLMKLSSGNDTIEGIHNEILAKFSEKIEVRRFERVTSEGFISAYNHAGNKLGVLVDTTANNPSEDAKALIRDIAMQVAAMSPMFVNRGQVDMDTLNKEKEIYKQQAIDTGKKEEIADRIAQGRLEKFFTEQCLVEQAFVKDGNKSVSDVLIEVSEATGSDVKVVRFIRFALGESSED